jgi:hypothetical protein
MHNMHDAVPLCLSCARTYHHHPPLAIARATGHDARMLPAGARSVPALQRGALPLPLPLRSSPGGWPDHGHGRWVDRSPTASSCSSPHTVLYVRHTWRCPAGPTDLFVYMLSVQLSVSFVAHPMLQSHELIVSCGYKHPS